MSNKPVITVNIKYPLIISYDAQKVIIGNESIKRKFHVKIGKKVKSGRLDAAAGTISQRKIIKVGSKKQS